jgi:hypothetical protein
MTTPTAGYRITLAVSLFTLFFALSLITGCSSGTSKSLTTDPAPTANPQPVSPSSPPSVIPNPPPSPSPSPSPSIPPSGVNIATYHMDNSRSGLNPNESTLTPANVNPSTFGKLFSYPVDGYPYAQPLYISGLTISGALRNVLYIATEKDSVYAFDADNYGTGAPLWMASLLQTNETPSSGAILPWQGITSTPVIDVTTNTLYTVTAQRGGSSPAFRLHALDLLTGIEKFGGPVAINASVPGTNADSVNGVLTLTGSCLQRSALLLANNSIYIGFGGCHSGWLIAYDAHSLLQTGVMNMSPNVNGYGKYGGAGGVWMGGGGAVSDSDGNIYISTGNGYYDDSTSYGDSVLKLNPQLHLLDSFTPYDWAYLQCDDVDLASGGVMIVPNTANILAGGKSGIVYMLNTDDLGGMKAADIGAVQSLSVMSGLFAPFASTCVDNKGVTQTGLINSYQIYSTPSYFNDSVYIGVVPGGTSLTGTLRRFTYSDNVLTPAETSKDSIAHGSYSGTAFISSNGTTNGIVWLLDHGQPIQNADSGAAPTPAILRAYDATDLSIELYNSSKSIDVGGLGIKFTSAIAANGKVFIGTAHDPATIANPQGEVDVFGLK